MIGRGYSLFSALLEILSGFGIALHILVLLVFWNLLPSAFPVHFNLSGGPDALGSRTDLVLLFCIGAGLFVGLSWLQRIPEKFNYPWKINSENRGYQFQLARRFVQWLKAEVAWLFAFLNYQIIKTALGWQNEIAFYLIPAILIFSTMTIVAYFYLAIRNP